MHALFGRGSNEEQPTVKGRNGAKKWDRLESEGTATAGRSKDGQKELGRGIGKFYTAPAPMVGTGAPSAPSPATSLAPWAAAGATVIAGGYLGMRAMRSWATQRWKDTLTGAGPVALSLSKPDLLSNPLLPPTRSRCLLLIAPRAHKSHAPFATAAEQELKQVPGDPMDAFVADMTTNLVGVDRDQMSAALSDAKNKEARL